jgi:predicted unusual protein kinase regulating ubiquinone biosynthesis (AarF/ABC1/UbiB family)
MFRNRYRQILWFFGRAILSFGWWDILLPAIGLKKWAEETRPARLRRTAASFRALAVQLGGVMIKVGQFLSARLDVLPKEVTEELSGLQDEVRPEKFIDIQTVVEAEFGTALSEKFAAFDEQPLASASIGQVHRAQIAVHLDGQAKQTQAVVVKVQRPHIEEIVAVDLSALSVVGRWLNYYGPIRKRADVPALLEEFSRTLEEEIDYLHEGKNIERFAENFANDTHICIPKVYWSHTTRQVITLEEIVAFKITDYAAIEESGINRAEVADRLINTYLKQIFEDRFFHADPHPGNLFVLPLNDAEPGRSRDWKLVFVDFGMTGEISEQLLQGLKELLIAAGTRDAPRLIRAYKLMGIILPGADIQLLEKASAKAFERFWGKTAPELMELRNTEAVEFAKEFGDLLYDMPFQIPQNLILLGRSLGILSGLCSGLNPDFNFWTSAVPYAEKLIRAEKGEGWQFWLGEISNLAQTVIGFPKRTEALFTRLEQGKLEIQLPDTNLQLRRLNQSIWGLAKAVIFAAILIPAVQLYLNGHWLESGIMGSVGLIIFGWFIFGR